MDGNDYQAIADAGKVAAAITGLAEKIAADFTAPDGNAIPFALVGLHQLGVPLAERLRKAIMERTGTAPELGMLDISMYRDDVGMRKALPAIRESRMPFVMDEAKVILVDDVLSSGRTIRAALDALNDYGRPALIKLAVLVDRGQPEYPIRADYAGFTVSVSPERKVRVRFAGENADVDEIGTVSWQK